MQPKDQKKLKQATQDARQLLDTLDLSEAEKRFAEQEAQALVKSWGQDKQRMKKIAAARLRPRVVPAVFAYAFQGARELYDYAMKEYPSRGA